MQHASNHGDIVAADKKYLMQTYGRFDVAPAKGKNAVIYDFDGRKFIDFTAGIGVNSLGVADSGWIKAVEAQLESIQHISNYYYSAATSLAAKKIVEASGLRRAFFGNSGAEANEGAIKTARKYSFDKYGKGRSTIVTLTDSFHGRTITTLAATGQENFHRYFDPFTEGFKYVPLNDKGALSAALTSDVCAVMAEPIQGEGGVNLMSAEYADYLRRICDARDVLLIFDEVQCGVARTGKMFAFQYFPNCVPDLLTMAKGLGGGLPVGVFAAGPKCENTLTSGLHGTTFGGNPVVAAGVCEVLNRVNTPAFLAAVNQKGEYFRSEILGWKLKQVREVRGRGLMIGIAINGDPHKVAAEAVQLGLLVLTAGRDVVRLLPPLTITQDEIDEGLYLLNEAIVAGTRA